MQFWLIFLCWLSASGSNGRSGLPPVLRRCGSFPGDVQRFPVDKTRCDLAPCAFVNLLHGRAGNIHLRGTLLVGLLLQVNQPNDLVFVQRQQDRLGILAPVGAEGINLWCATNTTAPWRSWRALLLLFFFLFSVYSISRRKIKINLKKPYIKSR